MSSHRERERLILSLSELSDICENNEFEDEFEFCDSKEAFLNQSIFKFVVDEVHSMLQTLFCDVDCMTSCFNPFYDIIFILFFVITLTGAFIHFFLLDFFPVRKVEMPEERELRTQGLYTAIGSSAISLPFSILGLYEGTNSMIIFNYASLIANVCIIGSCLIVLRAIAEQYYLAIRIFVVGSWIIVVFLIGLALVDVYSYLTLSWLSLVDYFLRLIEIFVYIVIAVQCVAFWNIYPYSRPRHTKKDYTLASILGIMFAVIIIAFVVAFFVSEDHSWSIFSW